MNDPSDKRHRGDILGRVTPSRGVAVPTGQFDDYPVTDVSIPDGPEREKHRNARTPEEALPHLHRRVGELEADSKNHLRWRAQVSEDVGEIKGTMKTLTETVVPQLTEAVAAISKRDADRAQTAYAGNAAVETAKRVDAIDAGKTARDVAAEKTKTKWAIAREWFGKAGFGAMLIEILHRIGVL